MASARDGGAAERANERLVRSTASEVAAWRSRRTESSRNEILLLAGGVLGLASEVPSREEDALVLVGLGWGRVAEGEVPYVELHRALVVGKRARLAVLHPAQR